MALPQQQQKKIFSLFVICFPVKLKGGCQFNGSVKFFSHPFLDIFLTALWCCWRFSAGLIDKASGYRSYIIRCVRQPTFFLVIVGGKFENNKKKKQVENKQEKKENMLWVLV
jgi:hypothetical protein